MLNELELKGYGVDVIAAYFQCAYWTEEETVGCAPLSQEADIDGLTDVMDFLEKANKLVDLQSYRADLMGHDIWLTRNGHGAGFWDGDWPEPDATTLDNLAKELGQADLYLGDDGFLYFA